MSDMVHREGGKLGFPYGEASSDEEVLAAVLNALHHNSGIPSEHLRAEVSKGRVVLTGVVGQDFERTMAETAAASAPGVSSVENHITLAS